MKRRILEVCLAGCGLVCASPHVFSVHDDLLAYPQYEVVFSDSYISDKEASSRLSYASALSATDTQTPSTPSEDVSTPTGSNTAELSHVSPLDQSSTSDTQFSHDSQTDRLSETYEHMILDSKPYLCAIPQPPKPSRNRTSSQRAAEEEAAELARATDRGWELLQGMTGSCLYFISGWWSYSFCYAQSVKQYHQLPPGKGGAPIFPPVEDPGTPSYVLGRFGDRRVNAHRSGMAGAISGSNGGGAEKEAGLGMEDRSGDTTQLQAKGSSNSRYLSQKLSGGTTCDLTGIPRRVEIQFHCNPQTHDRIGWIREVSTCSYLMMVYTARLCNDVAFSPPREEKAEQIVCREVVAEDEVGEWKARKSREAERKLVSDTAESSMNKLPVIGGIVVGGMKEVGQDGRRLEPPANFQPGSHGHGNPPGADGAGSGSDQNVRTELVAKMDPNVANGKFQRVSDEKLKKMGMDVTLVDAARRRLEAMAGNKKWRLEASYVDGHWELKGIVEGDDEEGDYEDQYAFEQVDDGWVEEPDGDDGEEGSQEEYREYRDEL